MVTAPPGQQATGSGNFRVKTTSSCPFATPGEEDLVADVEGRRLFELDRERLRRIRALIDIVHGLSPDDGVCMEIGYAAARGVPHVQSGARRCHQLG